MRSRSTAVFLLALLVGCASGPSGPSGPVVSPTGIVYPPGVPPTDTRYSQTAALFLRSGEADRALDQALEGIAFEEGNPIHHFLAGVAQARLGAYDEADAAFARAQDLYPAYELDIEPERLAAWAEAFNRGTDAYADGRDDEAMEAWRGAATMYNLRPDAHSNLAMLLAQNGEMAEAVAVYEDLLDGLERAPATRVLTPEEETSRAEARVETEARLGDLFLLTGQFARAEAILRARVAADPDNASLRMSLASALTGLDRHEAADSIHQALLSDRTLEETQLYNLGVALFRSSAPDRAADAFRRLTVARPDSRDAWFNYVNALFASEDWAGIVEASEQLRWVDPLGESAALLLARGLLESGDEQGALEELERIDGAPVHVEGLALRNLGSESSVHGRLVGNGGEVGSPLRLRFVFYGEDETARADTTLAVPAPDASEPFEVSVRMRAAAYRYELLSPAGREP